MIYYGTEKAELIYFQLENEEDEQHFIAMIMDCDEAVFYVRTCCMNDWEWKFHYTASNYDMVKHAIFDAGFDHANMKDMLWELDGIFEDILDEIVVWDEDECDCGNNCGHCNCR